MRTLAQQKDWDLLRLYVLDTLNRCGEWRRAADLCPRWAERRTVWKVLQGLVREGEIRARGWAGGREYAAR